MNQNKARKAREQQEIIRAVADGIVGAQNATLNATQQNASLARSRDYRHRTPSHYTNVSVLFASLTKADNGQIRLVKTTLYNERVFACSIGIIELFSLKRIFHNNLS